MYFGLSPVGILCFGLMGYVNIDIPAEDEEEWEHDEHETYAYDVEHEDA